jgi:hypothetical protein
MKKSTFKFILPVALVFLTLSYSCKKFLDKSPLGAANATQLANKAGVDGLLIGAYAILEGNPTFVTGGTYGASPSNWSFGGIGSDDANKGSNATDQPDAAQIMNHSVSSTNGYINDKWATMLAGVQRANDVLRTLPLVKDGSITADYAKEVIAEARFLRAVFNLENSEIFVNVPYVDETITYVAGNYNVGNPGPIWDKIEADLKAAMADLPATQAQKGRANKYAAEAFLAKTYMFEHKYPEAKAAIADLILNGTTSSGAKYALGFYKDNFDQATEDGPEAVFAVEMAVQDNSQGANGNPGDILNNPAAGPTTCCGFYQPSFSLVNSFKTTAAGLPFLDGSFDNTALKSDQAVDASALYLPDTTTPLDPRLDWTAGRRGIPFLDWGPMPGASWARAQADAGPYINVKNVYRKSESATASDAYGGWATGQSTGINFNMIRYADVILWAAECEVEVGTLAAAEGFVNQIRTRAANPAGWVMGRLTGYTGGDYTKPIVDNTLPAANYKISPYTGQIATGTKASARLAVLFEERLEFGMEGRRFFNLQRLDGRFGGPEPAGFMAGVLNAYIQKNTSYDPDFFANSVLKGAVFTAGRNEVYPIPQTQIDKEHGALKQNAGGY